MTSIVEALLNAEHNLTAGLKGSALSIRIGLAQLHNAVGLLEKGYPIDTEVDPLLEKYGTVENTPKFIEERFIVLDEFYAPDGGTDEKA